MTVLDNDGELSQVGIASFVSNTGCHTEMPAGKLFFYILGIPITVFLFFLVIVKLSEVR